MKFFHARFCGGKKTGKGTPESKIRAKRDPGKKNSEGAVEGVRERALVKRRRRR